MVEAGTHLCQYLPRNDRDLDRLQGYESRDARHNPGAYRLPLPENHIPKPGHQHRRTDDEHDYRKCHAARFVGARSTAHAKTRREPIAADRTI